MVYVVCHHCNLFFADFIRYSGHFRILYLAQLISTDLDSTLYSLNRQLRTQTRHIFDTVLP